MGPPKQHVYTKFMDCKGARRIFKKANACKYRTQKLSKLIRL